MGRVPGGGCAGRDVAAKVAASDKGVSVVYNGVPKTNGSVVEAILDFCAACHAKMGEAAGDGVWKTAKARLKDAEEEGGGGGRAEKLQSLASRP